jgi:acetylornithine deacetylase
MRTMTEIPPIDDERLMADLIDLLCIPSVSGTDAEVEAQAWLASRWADEGLEVDRWDIDLDALTADPQFPGMEVDRRHAIGLTGTLRGNGSGPTLLLNGHTDVVPPGDLDAWSSDPFVPQRETIDGVDRVIARGACDMKAGVAAMWAAVRAVQRAGITLTGDVVLAPVSGEEDGGLGTFSLLRHGGTADMCVVPEPTSLNVMSANGGALTFRLTVRGLATHAARRTEGVSAIEKFWPVWQALVELEQRRHEVVDPLMSRWPLAHPLSIGAVTAGDWASSVPDLLVAEGRLGVALGERVEHARADLEQTVAELNARDPWHRQHPVELEWWGGQFAPGRLPADSDLIDRVRAAHAVSSIDVGRSQRVYGAPYGSDLRLLTGMAGIPTVQYGPGDVRLAHGPRERVPIDDVVTTARTLALLALDVCGEA